MCGIVGWVTRRPVSEPHNVLTRALNAIEHRGPDGNGIWIESGADQEQVALAHCRLAIIDLTGSAQPLHSHDGRFTVTYNGEIYNYLELREELKKLGLRFTSNGDTEVVVEAYRQWGTEAFSKFRGMYAFALWDADHDRLIIARDQVGKKPLYLAEIAEGIAFASEIGALQQLNQVHASIDLDQIPAYLARRYITGPSTFFHQIRKLQPGHFLIYEKGMAREQRFYETPLLSIAPRARPLAENVERLGNLLDESVRLRMRSDAPFGLYLSGGLDSSVILALMQRHSASPVRTFSVGFEGSNANELSPAKRTAQDFDTMHHELTVTAGDFAAAWPRCVALRGAPVSEASDIAIHLLSKAAHSTVKMVLTGEGADELLAGYPKFWAERWLARYHAVIPPALHRRLFHPLIARLPYRFDRLKIFSRAAGTAHVAVRARNWFASGGMDLIERLTRGSAERETTERPRHSSQIRALQIHDFEYWLPDNLLERGDRMMMGGSVEGRMPFMDVKLAELAAEFPEDHLIQGRRGKIVLREIAKQLLRPELLARPKIGFAVPLESWFRGPLQPMMRDLLQSGNSKVRTLVDAAVLDSIVASHMKASQNHAKLLWSLANLELFLRMHQH
ncbi:asparagine synthase (glutamine-hydrolyzing) [Bordetella sp. FB-8]|uniref:asparagine synthase (glutamine-hydrolyzing) n=1 Tax=Bordetella sp. FB-8 TaxID=1159870 RepID=UPI00035CE9F5|nr:asparagine synthase (glutamine-hydrolyzing) [Bordetella sp. FB-8]